MPDEPWCLPFKANRIPRFRALRDPGFRGHAAAPVLLPPVFPEFVARANDAKARDGEQGQARKPQPAAQRRDRVSTWAKPSPLQRQRPRPGPQHSQREKATHSGKTGTTASARVMPTEAAARRAPLGRRPPARAQRPGRRPFPAGQQPASRRQSRLHSKTTCCLAVMLSRTHACKPACKQALPPGRGPEKPKASQGGARPPSPLSETPPPRRSPPWRAR